MILVRETFRKHTGAKDAAAVSLRNKKNGQTESGDGVNSSFPGNICWLGHESKTSAQILNFLWLPFEWLIKTLFINKMLLLFLKWRMSGYFFPKAFFFLSAQDTCLKDNIIIYSDVWPTQPMMLFFDMETCRNFSFYNWVQFSEKATHRKRTAGWQYSSTSHLMFVSVMGLLLISYLCKGT